MTHADPNRYVDYYKAQAGNGLPGFSGASVMYGGGLGGIFRGLFRMALPLLKKGFNIAKPHLTSAAKNIATEVFTKVMNRRTQKPEQEGSGLAVMTQRRRKRPPGGRVNVQTTWLRDASRSKTKKQRVLCDGPPFGKNIRKVKQRRKAAAGKDIF